MYSVILIHLKIQLANKRDTLRTRNKYKQIFFYYLSCSLQSQHLSLFGPVCSKLKRQPQNLSEERRSICLVLHLT